MYAPLILIYSLAVPSQPNTTYTVSSKSIEVNINLVIKGFTVSEYCVNFTRIAVSNVRVPAIPSHVLTLCSSNSSVTLSNVEEDATYEYVALVNNTVGNQSPPSTPMTVRTLSASEFVP